ncbi:MAG TPA: CsbD family protein [Stellaceae bacterium]|nr:CsbD family protein [Stellaceae bacterium]
MDRDRIAGSVKQIKGSIKKAVGKMVGDAKLQIDGKVDQAEGKAQNLAGTIKDSVKS